MEEKIKADVLIIGSGIAGATAAISLADAGADVLVVTRAKSLCETNSYYAQGGIIYKGNGGNDSSEKLVADIMAAGAGMSNIRAAGILAAEGPELVEEFLIGRVGVNFDKDGIELGRTREGGHSVRRIIHCADETGRLIQEAVASALLRHSNIRIKTGVTAVDLLTPGHHSSNRLAVYEPLTCAGAYLLDQETGLVSRGLAKQTILATGGLGQIYEFTTNPEGARGDGVAMADRAGARIINLEFIQFHPTSFYHPAAPRFLITEAARGEGAKLVNYEGRPFMDKYDERGDLATRDVIARSIYKEMVRSGASNVYLDMKSYIPQAKIAERFPSIRRRLMEYGIDIAKDLIPVVPAAHYSCGGVYVDAESGETTIDNLYAVGEIACTGLHGANRLASTSLLEGLVWGNRAYRAILGRLKQEHAVWREDIRKWEDLSRRKVDMSLINQDLKMIRGLMWNCVGLERTVPRLIKARTDLGYIERAIERFYQDGELSDSLIGLRNIARAAVLVAEAAWANRKSAGCHYRV